MEATDWNDNIFERIYEREVLDITNDGAHCGMWQFYQASNVICYSVKSVYPFWFMTDEYRKDINRTAYQIRLHQRELKNIGIMWTPMRLQGQPTHFVPLVKL